MIIYTNNIIVLSINCELYTYFVFYTLRSRKNYLNFCLSICLSLGTTRVSVFFLLFLWETKCTVYDEAFLSVSTTTWNCHICILEKEWQPFKILL